MKRTSGSMGEMMVAGMGGDRAPVGSQVKWWGGLKEVDGLM